MGVPFLRIENISKSFPGIHALDKIAFTIQSGEIHALVGENGAGKSTLVKVIGGIYQPDSGTLVLEGFPVTFSEPVSSQKAGISIIHQELSLALDLNVTENIFLGREILGRFNLVNDSIMVAQTRKILSRLDPSIEPQVLVRFLRHGQRQIVEIAKALSQNARLLILDEPTSSLTPHETDNLFHILRRLKKENVSILYISHHLEEIFQIADRVSILRDGQYIGTRQVIEVTQHDLIQMMIGRTLSYPPKEKKSHTGEIVLSVEQISFPGSFENISFELHSGEILGMAGLLGSGRTEVVRAIFGAELIKKGKIFLRGRPIFISSPQMAVELGIGLVPEDRRLQGLLLNKTIRENVSLAFLPHLCSLGFIQSNQEGILAEKMRQELDIRCSSVTQSTGQLSGGNQQKVVIAKWLASGSDILLLDEPTRGVDVGAKSEIHHLIRVLAEKGKAILVVSSDLPEILSLCDRILVMHEGRLVGEIDGPTATQEEIMRMATSIHTSTSPLLKKGEE
ncbi:MAG: sugar ABC transporter ATP-binding protein [Candidatus Atribacteria bacterium]|nr:sugar ABC transporter ATP-binding protein [Candidatus Atribacteria bacterium]